MELLNVLQSVLIYLVSSIGILLVLLYFIISPFNKIAKKQNGSLHAFLEHEIKNDKNIALSLVIGSRFLALCIIIAHSMAVWLMFMVFMVLLWLLFQYVVLLLVGRLLSINCIFTNIAEKQNIAMATIYSFIVIWVSMITGSSML